MDGATRRRATLISYDTLRSGEVAYYLVRARNLCPGASGLGPLGHGSSGAVTGERDCP